MIPFEWTYFVKCSCNFSLSIYWFVGYPKLVGLLKGKFVCLNDNHRMRLNEVTSSIYQRLNPSEAVPYLQQNGVISPEEAAEIRKVETNKSRSDAALELQYILPNRHRNWYELTIWSLVESKQVELAEIIDGALTYGRHIFRIREFHEFFFKQTPH